MLFGGPLYVLYKAVAALLVARRLEAHTGRPVVPVFWVASDDHDFAEVRSTAVLDDAGRIRTLRYAPASEPAGLPTSHVRLDATIENLLREARSLLPAGPHREASLDALGASYRPGKTLARAFARLLSFWLPSLVILDPSDPALKALMLPTLQRELTEGSPTSALATKLAGPLHEAGFHQQVPVRPGFLNLFLFEQGQRRALAYDDEGLEVRGAGLRMSLAEARERLAADPAAWSPGVLLRPLAQDLLLPTAAYVGGPAEIAYHAQLGPSYEHFGIPRPALVPRPSVTLVEPPQARAMKNENLTLTDLQADPESQVARWAREAHPAVEAAFAEAREATAHKLEEVERLLAELDPTLRAAADATRGRALHQIDNLHEKAVRALKKRDQVRADRLRRTRDALFPGGLFQERCLGWIGLVARHGRGVVDLLGERIDPWARGHQVVWLRSDA